MEKWQRDWQMVQRGETGKITGRDTEARDGSKEKES